MRTMNTRNQLFRDPNGPAYQRDEVRHGPPLDNAGERLLAMSHDEFDRWLDFIEREGSTTGA